MIRSSRLGHVVLSAFLYAVAAALLYLPTLGLEWNLLDEPGDTVYSYRLVEGFLAHPSLKQLRAEKDPFRLNPIHYVYHYALSKAFGLVAFRHHAFQVALLCWHVVLMAWLFCVLCGSAWWAAPAVFYYLLFIPDDRTPTAWNSTPYNFYTLMTLEPLMIALLGAYATCAASVAFGSGALLRGSDGATATAGRRAVRFIQWAVLGSLAIVIVFTKETACFYSFGVVAFAVALWRRGARRSNAAAVGLIYVVACAFFIACYFYVIGTGKQWAAEVQPWDSPGNRASRIGTIIVDAYGPILVCIAAAYGLILQQRRVSPLPRIHLDVEWIAAAFLVPSLAQLIAWPNFQPRLLLPHAWILALIAGLTVWRLWRVGQVRDAPEVSGGRGKLSRNSALAQAILVIMAACSVVYAVNAAMCYHNFRTVFRANELSRVRAYQESRDWLDPGSRLFVAIMRGDQIFDEIRWRLDFFDRKPNRVVELQPRSEKPAAGDVIYYHPDMARVKLSGSSLDRREIREEGTLFVHTGWHRLIGAVVRLRSPFETRRGSNRYDVYKVRQAGERQSLNKSAP